MMTDEEVQAELKAWGEYNAGGNDISLAAYREMMAAMVSELVTGDEPTIISAAVPEEPTAVIERRARRK